MTGASRDNRRIAVSLRGPRTAAGQPRMKLQNWFHKRHQFAWDGTSTAAESASRLTRNGYLAFAEQVSAERFPPGFDSREGEFFDD